MPNYCPNFDFIVYSRLLFSLYYLKQQYLIILSVFIIGNTIEKTFKFYFVYIKRNISPFPFSNNFYYKKLTLRVLTNITIMSNNINQIHIGRIRSMTRNIPS